MLTRDDDCLTLHGAGARHAGILSARPDLCYGYLIDELHLAAGALSADEMRDNVHYL